MGLETHNNEDLIVGILLLGQIFLRFQEIILMKLLVTMMKTVSTIVYVGVVAQINLGAL